MPLFPPEKAAFPRSTRLDRDAFPIEQPGMTQRDWYVGLLLSGAWTGDSAEQDKRVAAAIEMSNKIVAEKD